jgi:hypothetical protein
MFILNIYIYIYIYYLNIFPIKITSKLFVPFPSLSAHIFSWFDFIESISLE